MSPDDTQYTMLKMVSNMTPKLSKLGICEYGLDKTLLSASVEESMVELDILT